MSIYEELAKARRAIPLTQNMLAERAQLSRMTVSNAEAGKDPQMSTVLEMARAMGMELMLVPKTLRVELENFIQSGGRIVGQQSGVDAPRSIVETMVIRDPTKEGFTRENTKRFQGAAHEAVKVQNTQAYAQDVLSQNLIATPSGVFHPSGYSVAVDNGEAADSNRPVVAQPKAATKSRAVPRPKGR